MQVNQTQTIGMSMRSSSDFYQSPPITGKFTFTWITGHQVHKVCCVADN